MSGVTRSNNQVSETAHTNEMQLAIFAFFSRPHSLRSRLALWNALVIFLSLILLGLIVYETMTYLLTADLDNRLHAQANKLEAMTMAATGRPYNAAFFNQLARGEPVNEFTTNSLYIKLFDKDTAHLMAISPHLDQVVLSISQADFNAARHGQQILSSLVDKSGNEVHTLTLGLYDKYRHLVVVAQVCQSLQIVRQVQVILLSSLGLRSLLIAIIAYGFIFWLTSFELRPLNHLIDTMRNFSIQRLQTRLHPQRSVTEIQQLADAFNRMTERLEASFVLQRDFVTDVSHELRTPLTATQGLLDVVLLNPELKEESRYDLQQASAELMRLSRLVGNLLTSARADVGVLPQPFSNGVTFVELDLLVVEVARQLRFLNQKCDLEIRQLEQVSVPGDVDMLKQLLLNLVENALTHAGADCRVILELIRSKPGAQPPDANQVSQAKEWALLHIIDNGPGIDPTDLPHIFERYYRAKGSNMRSKHGSGLGLSIARLIAQAHGGYITVESELGKGTCFNVWLPIA